MIEPAYLSVPPRLGSYGDEVIDLARLAGLDPDEEQQNAIDAMASYGAGGNWAAAESGIVEARQCGKCLAVDTVVLTANRGLVTMADVVIGDRVFHPEGHDILVSDVSPVWLGHDCYRVTTTDGRSVVADADHLWTVADKRHTRTVAGRRVPIKATVTTREMAVAGVSRYASGGRSTTCDGKTYAVNEYRFTLPRQWPIKSADVDLPVDPYLLGAWLGDGSSDSATLTANRAEVPYWTAAIAAGGFTPNVRNVAANKAAMIGIGSRPQGRFTAILRQLGVLHDKHVPLEYLCAGSAQRLALLQGLMDTDGSIVQSYRSARAEFCSTRRQLALDVLYLARSLGWRATVIEADATLNGRVVGRRWRVFWTPVAGDPAPFRMERKARRVAPSRARGGELHAVSIKSIEPVPSVPVRCIKVDSPDGLFLAGRDLVATHNTTNVMEPVVMFDFWLMEPDRIVWTAHRFRTARQSFENICVYVDTAPELSRRVKKINRSHGEEFIELHPRKDHPGEPGAKLEFLARESSGGRGLGGKRVVFDEALILGAEGMDALVPILSARFNSHLMYGSSAAKMTSTYLHNLVTRGRAGDDQLIWVEYCAPGSWENPGCAAAKCMHAPSTDGCALDNESLWPLANHAVRHTKGKRVSYAAIRKERRVLTPVGFGRERLGWHEMPVNADGVIGGVLWQSRKDLESEAAGRVGVGLDASPDLQSAAVGMAGVRGDGKRHWQVLRHDAGTGWVIPYFEQTKVDLGSAWDGRIGLDPASPAGALIVPLQDAGFEVVDVSGRTLVQAWGSFKKDVDDDNGRHIGQHTLDQAIRDAATAPSGDVERFSRKKSSGDICPLVSVVVSDHVERTAEVADPWVLT